MNTTTNTTCTYPAFVARILEELNSLDNPKDYEWVYNEVGDRLLTETFCFDNDFIVLKDDEAFLFEYNEQTNIWSVQCIGEPLIWVNPKEYGVDAEKLDQFFNELEWEFPNVEIRYGSGETEFMRKFDWKIYDTIQAVKTMISR